MEGVGGAGRTAAAAQDPTGAGRVLRDDPYPELSSMQDTMADDTIHCTRCGQDAPALPKAPFRNDLGARIHAEICGGCWQEWLQHQTLLINHYGLDPRDAKARKFLYEQIEQVLLKGEDGKEVDLSQQGTIQW